MASFIEKDKECLQDWNDLRFKCKLFIIVALQAIDVICSEVLCMDVKDVVGKKNRCFNAGWEEPSFLSMGILDLKSNRPLNDGWINSEFEFANFG